MSYILPPNKDVESHALVQNFTSRDFAGSRLPPGVTGFPKLHHLCARDVSEKLQILEVLIHWINRAYADSVLGDPRLSSSREP